MFVYYIVVAVTFIILIESKVKYVANGETTLENSDSDRTDLCCVGHNSKEGNEDEWLRIDVTEFAMHFFSFLSRSILEAELHPLKIPDVGRSLWVPFLPPLPATYRGLTCYFFSGSLYYLSEIESNSIVIASYKDKTLRIDATIVFDDVMLTYDYFVKLFFLRLRGWMEAEASVLVNINIDFDISAHKLTLNKLQLNSIESIQVFVHGNILMEQLISPFSNIVTGMAHKALTKEIERQATLIFRESFKWINFILSWNVFTCFQGYNSQ
ncbi:uncharacterized protein LOC143187250 [Calliopsis andreniformis]|uniref:uncharacterized protein LOC143187250 n=1 Tax=Calliopsis andreniformis TaxID=337506 RepID=UPI003FCD939A